MVLPWSSNQSRARWRTTPNNSALRNQAFLRWLGAKQDSKAHVVRRQLAFKQFRLKDNCCKVKVHRASKVLLRRLGTYAV